MALHKRPKLCSRNNCYIAYENFMSNTKKEKKVPWIALVDSKDPTIRTRPVVTYVFNDGKRTFYKPRKR